MRRRFVELVAERRIVFTWGWATLGSQTPPFARTVEVALTPDGSGTRLKLVHSGFESLEEGQGHSKGWDLFLPVLAKAARTGRPAQPAAAQLVTMFDPDGNLVALIDNSSGGTLLRGPMRKHRQENGGSADGSGRHFKHRGSETPSGG